jgi:membrane-associated phospholipid phosphatase
MLSVAMLILVGAHQFHFLPMWQLRQGTQLNDVVIGLVEPRDFSSIIFFLEYSTVLLVFFTTLYYPEIMLRGLQMFVLGTMVRTITIYFVPLEPPHDMIFLRDPMAETFLHQGTLKVTKDLFISGHTLALVTLTLMTQGKWVRLYCVTATVLVAILIMWQHVHYSIDVLGATLTAIVVYFLVNWLHTQTKYGVELQDA